MEGPSSMILQNVVGDDQEDYNMDLPPGFRFHPTDEEIISHYLTPKVMHGSFSAIAVGEVDLNKCEPWDLPKKAKMGEKEWYFFCQRDRKYPTGMRTNRATESGYWKATGKDKEIYKKGRGGSLVGMKKTLVFYKGRAPKGEKTNWVMHEYRLEGQFSYYNFPKPAKDEWVVCRIFHKNTGIKRSPISTSGHGLLTRVNSSSFVDDLLMDYPNNSLPPLVDQQPAGNNSSFTDGTTEDEYTTIKGKVTASSSSPRSSDGGVDHRNYLSYFSADHLLDDVKNHVMPYSSYYMSSSSNPMSDFQFHPQIPHPNINNPVFPFKQASANLGYYDPGSIKAADIDKDRAMLSGAPATKNESRTMSVSQDTGVSTDATTAETSSVISKKDLGSNSNMSNYHDQDLDQDPSVGPVSDDLDDYLWTY
ncbi:hypothetical protein RHMOL_Rhmol04G0119200 [Rhododendron molle]|uniref:Uncharacterized protein n=2 Tax=Rhododendron molle TaxID=49168 RepID=A0ACC0P0N9_RHOML|nr:hypothetical protein RHMOL_Rhmol04G0119200 [Rhododendron molle]KAI8558726.1 hypothetical protein RHMOL_Rhmol04G0119200 [Rhododendron molle]